MRTNQAGQQLARNATSLPSDNYSGEFFSGPDATAIEGEVCYDGKAKEYKMAYLQGFPHVILESYFGLGVVVRYIITGESYSWNWKDRNNAWSWANARKAHINMLR
jgi:hypothetical protein